ncbi:O-fucosyltransferase 37 [Silene latifolia]|uniref:O-fucosyltransferase 37 n=1 Tax=Silene latifolia TaxID=37657 RepID=UPI003D76D564
MAKTRTMKTPLMFHLLSYTPFSTLLYTPRKSNKSHKFLQPSSSLVLLIFSLLTFFVVSILLVIGTVNVSHKHNCLFHSPIQLAFFSAIFPDYSDELTLSKSEMVPLPSHGVSAMNLSQEEVEFWKQPDNQGYVPCLDFGIGYRRESPEITSEKQRFLVVVASGGLNQQRNQIVDAVVIARILRAALVVPFLHVNFIWGDESEFADIFDVEHFKRTLQADVRVVSALPFTHLISTQAVETQIPFDVSPLWIRSRFSKQLKQEGMLVLKGLDSKLSKNLPDDLQKLRCKVAFHALRFSEPIRELGNRLARRMWIEGPYIAVHLRLEKDVWARTGCRTGLGLQYDQIIQQERNTRPKYLTGRVNMSYPQRRLAGLCPLNALEVARLLKALGAPQQARVYIAGGEPFGGSLALKPLVEEFPHLVTKETLATCEELLPFANRSSALAAVDYIVSLSSDVFLPSHGGNMARAMQGHRAYTGHRKYIRPNKRMMVAYYEDPWISEAEFGAGMRKLHNKSKGQPEPRTGKRDRDVIAYPVPECMCQRSSGFS